MPFFAPDDRLTQQATTILEEIWAKFPRLARNQLALTWLLYEPPYRVNTSGAITPEDFWQYVPAGYSYRGLEPIYPASVVKLFYLVAVHEWLDKGMLEPNAELERAMQDAIATSSNDATSLLVDALTGTTSGPELPPGPFASWQQQRNLVNRYYQALGWQELESINVNQKTWGDGPYGRERAFVGPLLENRNRLTTDACARLLHSIVGGVAVSAPRSQAMLALLQRQPNLPPPLPGAAENQVNGFLGGGLPENARLWSKAGWTSQVRHDVAYIEIPDVHPYLLAVFTTGGEQSQNRELLPELSRAFARAATELS
ncbi:MAG: serine hydrolase [Spirulinaceae cyanobacterium SM2_1_0]|nr:serine hydrolase [Spirulinaceae cyanobacterium SM2_1_0]